MFGGKEDGETIDHVHIRITHEEGGDALSMLSAARAIDIFAMERPKWSATITAFFLPSDVMARVSHRSATKV